MSETNITSNPASSAKKESVGLKSNKALVTKPSSKRVFTRKSQPVMVTEVVEADSLETVNDKNRTQIDDGKDVSQEKIDIPHMELDSTESEDRLRPVRMVRRRQYSQAVIQPPSGFRKMMYVVAPIVLILLVMVGGGLTTSYFASQSDEGKTEHVEEQILETVNDEPEAEPTVVITPEPVDKTTYSIRVLNGSGVAGAAGALRTSLTSEGFVVSAATNANRSDYEKSVIRVPADVNAIYLQELEAFLNLTYTTQIEEVEGLEVIEVIIGSELIS